MPLCATSYAQSLPRDSPKMAAVRRQRPMGERYERIERIGEGAFGLVFKARNTETHETVAMKKIKFEPNEQGIQATTLREITVLKTLHCENVVSLEDVIHEGNKLFLVFEYLDQDLKAYLDSIGPDEGMDPLILNSFAKQMLHGLAYCHSKAVIHRDLKPHNLLIDGRGNLKIADFGLARGFKIPIDEYTHEVVTLWYRAPEILLGSDHYSTGVDLWAAACIIAEMSNLVALFPGNSEIEQLFRVFKVLGTPTEANWKGVSLLRDYSPDFPRWPAQSLSTVVPRIGSDGINLLQALFRYAPTERLSAKKSLAHPFFAEAATSL